MKTFFSRRILLAVLLLVWVATLFYFRVNPFESKFLAVTGRAAGSLDWNQAQKDPGRSGFSSEAFSCTDGSGNPRACNFNKVWSYAFQPDRIHPAVQAIVYDDGTNGSRVFIGTEMGNMLAINAANGTKMWQVALGGPILNSAAADDGKVFVGSADGAVYALATADGLQVWKTYLYKGNVVGSSPRLGFSSAPLLANGKLMIGGRDGYFYALDPSTGAFLWAYNANSPILMSAAASGGKAFFGTLDMRVHAVNTLNGTLAWSSTVQLSGAALKDYWPIVTAGKVIVKAQPKVPVNSGVVPGSPFGFYSASTSAWYSQNRYLLATGSATLAPGFISSQDTVISSYNTNPASFTRKSLFILDETTGAELPTVPHFDVQSLAGTVTPGCVDRNGKLIVPILLFRSGWGRLDLTSGRITDVLFDDTFTQTDVPAGMGNKDENLTPTCSQTYIFGMHVLEGAANYTGAFSEDLRKWKNIAQGAANKGLSNNDMHALNPASVSNGTLYHLMWNELIARRAQ